MNKVCVKCGEEKSIAEFGKPKKKHLNPPCKRCVATYESLRRKRPEVALRSRASNKKWRANNKEKHAETYKKWNHANTDRIRQHKRFKRESRFGKVVHAEILNKQENRICDSCGIFQLGSKRLAVDHDHKTGRYRGVLCHACNKALGLMYDDPERILKLAQYQFRFMSGVE